jgi:hypothetical protein
MNFKELHEGAEPKMPGAPKGISIMTPQQFVASAGDMPEEEGVAEGSAQTVNLDNLDKLINRTDYNLARKGDPARYDDVEVDKRTKIIYWVTQETTTKQSQEFAIRLANILKNNGFNGWTVKVVRRDFYNGKRSPWKVAIVEQDVSEGFFGDMYHGAKHGIKLMTSPSYRALNKAANASHDLSYSLKMAERDDMIRKYVKRFGELPGFYANDPAMIKKFLGKGSNNITSEGVAEGDKKPYPKTWHDVDPKLGKQVDKMSQAEKVKKGLAHPNTLKKSKEQGVAEGQVTPDPYDRGYYDGQRMGSNSYHNPYSRADEPTEWDEYKSGFNMAQIELQNDLEDNGFSEGVAEGQEHLDRIRSLSGLGEATKLPAQTRDLDSQEFQDYMKRIVGTPDLDKAGNVKVDKKGNEKYTTGKTAGDKYKMPYIHRSSVVSYLSPDGKSYDEDAVKKTLSIRPKALLKQNEKMKHSNGEFEQFFNVGFAALVGIALDEQTNNLIVVNTCPGAGSCKVDCFAMKGGKIQFKAAWQSDGRILTYLLNDPDGFFNQLSDEISVESQAAAKGDKKFPNGWQVTVRWHDAGDFFSPEYLDLALKMAAKHPDVRFYAYTKMAGAALAQKPDNFIINWSEGANTTQEKQIKAKDPNLDTTKNSRIVPEKLFYDLLAKDEKGNLKKTDDGAWQPASPEALAEMKQRIAKEYGISVSSILSYTEYMAKRNSIPAGMKYNVIVAPGEGDVSANDPGVLSTLLLRH